MKTAGMRAPTKFSAFSKVFAGALVFCLLVNGFVPRFSVSKETHNLLSRIATNQSALLTFFSFSTIPLQLVNEIYAGRQSAARTERSSEKTDETTNSSADYSLYAQTRTVLTERLTADRFGMTHVADHASVATRLILCLLETARGAPPGHAFGLLAFLVLFFILPRSNIAEEPARLRSVHMSPFLLFRSGFFYWRNFYARA